MNADPTLEEVYNKMSQYFEDKKFRSTQLQKVPSDYYQRSLEERAELLKAPSTAYLCKTILMENTAFDPQFESPRYTKYIAIMVQYISKINAERLEKWARKLNDNQLGKKLFHFRLAPEDVAHELTGYRYNALTPFLMKHKNIPLIFSSRIVGNDGFFWLGGGHVDLKLRMSVEECVQKYTDYVYIVNLDNWI